MTHVRIPGHQYEWETWVKVSSRPGCPAVGVSCRSWRISRLSISSGGTTRCPSFSQPPCSSSTSSSIECKGLHFSMVARYCSCTSWILEHREVVVREVVLTVVRLRWHCSQFSTYLVTQFFMSGHQ